MCRVLQFVLKQDTTFSQVNNSDQLVPDCPELAQTVNCKEMYICHSVTPSHPANTLLSSGPHLPEFLLPFRKPKRIRTAFSPSQLLKLEQAFEKNQYVVGQERKELAKTLNLSETQVTTFVSIHHQRRVSICIPLFARV